MRAAVLLALAGVALLHGRPAGASPEFDYAAEDGFDQAADAVPAQEEVTKEKARIDDETLPLVLEQIDDQDCRDGAEKVLLGLIPQSELDEACNRKVYDAYQVTPMGQLQQREHQVTTMAGIVRLTPRCQRQYKKPAEGEEAKDPSEECKEALQKQQQAMMQWISAVTYPKYSDTCKQQIKDLQSGHGHLTVECVAEMKTVKPSALETLETQTESMAAKQEEERTLDKEKRKARQAENRAKEEEMFLQREARREKKANDRFYSRIFAGFWTLVAVAAVGMGWKYYYEHPELHRKFPSAEQMLQEEQAAQEQVVVPLSKRQEKLKAREDKKKEKMQNARR